MALSWRPTGPGPVNEIQNLGSRINYFLSQLNNLTMAVSSPVNINILVKSLNMFEK